MPRPAHTRPALTSAARPVLIFQPCRDFSTLRAFYRDQFPGFSGDLISAAIGHLASDHSFLTIQDERSLIGAIGAITYETRPATELFLEYSTLRGIGIHKILAALEAIWAFHTNDKIELCFCVTDEGSISYKNYSSIGFNEIDRSDKSLPLEERERILGVPVQRQTFMTLQKSDVERPVKWLKSRFHSGRFLVSSPGMPTFKLEDASFRISLFRAVAGMKSLPDDRQGPEDV